MTQDQTNALENLMRANARLKAAKRELKEAKTDQLAARQRAQLKVPEMFYIESSDEEDDG